MVMLVSAMIGFALKFEENRRIQDFLVIVAVIIVFVSIYLIYRMQTKYRPEMLSGDVYLKYISEKFRNFQPENINIKAEDSLDRYIDFPEGLQLNRQGES